MKRLFFLILLVLAGLWTAGVSPEKIRGLFAGDDPGKSGRFSEARGSVGYILSENQWTLFAPPGDFGTILVRAAGNFKAPFTPEPDRRYPYQLHYQVLDRDRNVLIDRIYHLNAGLTLYGDETGENAAAAKFFVGNNLVPGDSRTVPIDVPPQSGAAFIRFKTGTKDPAVADVVMWAYYPDPLSGKNAAHLWKRLRGKKKERLARGSVYPHDLLSDHEKLNLLDSQWVPLGPAGIENQDYLARRVYILNETEGERLAPPVTPEGFFLSANHVATLPVPEPGGALAFEIKAAPGAKPPGSEKDNLLLRWHGENRLDRRDILLPWPDGQTTEKTTVAPGLLEIGPPPFDTVFKAFLSDPETGQKTEKKRRELTCRF